MTHPQRRARRVGHKGADHIAPGNTPASFDAALAHGVDMIEWDDAGLIQRFDVMIRPQSALTAVIEQMAAELMRMLEG